MRKAHDSSNSTMTANALGLPRLSSWSIRSKVQAKCSGLSSQTLKTDTQSFHRRLDRDMFRLLPNTSCRPEKAFSRQNRSEAWVSAPEEVEASSGVFV